MMDRTGLEQRLHMIASLLCGVEAAIGNEVAWIGQMSDHMDAADDRLANAQKLVREILEALDR